VLACNIDNDLFKICYINYRPVIRIGKKRGKLSASSSKPLLQPAVLTAALSFLGRFKKATSVKEISRMV